MAEKAKQKGAAKNASEPIYEVQAFVARYGVPAAEAGLIIKRYGPSRRKLDAYMASRNA